MCYTFSNNMNLCGFSDLPDEIVVFIFSFLDGHTVNCILPRVCQIWNQIASQPILWNLVPVTLDYGQKPCSALYPECISFVKAKSYSSLSLLSHCKKFHRKKVDDQSSVEPVLPTSDEQPPLWPQCNKSVDDVDLDYLKPILCQLRIVHINEINGDQLNLLSIYLENVRELKVLTRISHSSKLELNAASLAGMEHLQLDITGCSSRTLEEISASMPNLKSFSAIDRLPTPDKINQLSNMPVASLHLAESWSAEVILSSTLVAWLSTGRLSNLRELRLHSSRLNDEGAKAIRSICTRLQVLEVVKPSCTSHRDKLTEDGILHLLHLPLLVSLEVQIPEGRDYFYFRKRWDHHSCNAAFPCPDGLSELLKDWDNREPIIVIT